jgi:D-alanyl-D-alanine carboxypeptidase
MGRTVLAVAIVAALVGGSASAAGASGRLASTGSASVGASTSSATVRPVTVRSTSVASSYWVVVNKQRRLSPKTYVPKDLVTVPVAHVYTPKLRKKASDAAVTMFKAFKRETGKSMQSQSAYRSYTTQKSTYAGWVSALGKKGADLTSARPGYSEHQTGLAIDISAKPAKCSLSACFASTTQGKWLKKNAWKYGFILRYPKGMTKITGYEFEPWHYRFVGKDLAKKMKVSGTKTLEQYFHLPAARTYKKP